MKTQLRYYFLPIRLVKIKQFGNIPCWWGCERNGNSHTFLVTMQNWIIHRAIANSYQMTYAFTFNPYISLLGIHSKGVLSKIWKTYTNNFSLKHYLLWNRMQNNGKIPREYDKFRTGVQARLLWICLVFHLYIYIYTLIFIFPSSVYWKCLKQWSTPGAMSTLTVFSKYYFPPRRGRVFKKDSWSQFWKRKCTDGSQSKPTKLSNTTLVKKTQKSNWRIFHWLKMGQFEHQ